MNKKLCLAFVALTAVPGLLCAQEKSQAQPTPSANPITTGEKALYTFISDAVIKSAEKVPEENYSFKPTPEVRSFGQLIGHQADEAYFFCSQAVSEENPKKGLEKTLTSKADLVAALKDGVAYCNKTLGGMTDAKGSEVIKFFGRDMARMTLVSLNTAHMDEHYGNMVTYMRLKGIVPPTSEKQPAPASK